MTTNNKLYIKHLDFAVPDEKLVLKDIENFESDSFSGHEEFLTNATQNLKLESVRVEKQLTIEEMTINLLDENLDAGTIDPEEIHGIIIATDRFDNLVNFGHYVQYEFDMTNAEDVFRVGGNFCINADYSLKLAKKLVQGYTETRNILIIMGTKYPGDLDAKIIGGYAVMGDSASLMVVTTNPEEALYEYKEEQYVFRGKMNDLDYKTDNTILHFQAYDECLSKILEKVKTEDIKSVILHNANHLLVEQVLLRRGIGIEKIYKANQGTYGHLGSTDLVYNLKTIHDEIDSGDLLLTLNIGVTGTYTAMILEKT